VVTQPNSKKPWKVRSLHIADIGTQRKIRQTGLTPSIGKIAPFCHFYQRLSQKGSF
jgi:hypothetical protein